MKKTGPESWKKDFTPIRLGRHMVVKPSWCEYEAQAGDHIIELDPGMAFGTGTHETTGMCVRLVEEHVRPGQKVIDLGTGTGILAIAAAHMGARDVLAIDLDAVAVRVAKENVENNGFAGIIRVQQGDLLDHVDEAADVVVANIIADVIIALCGPVKRHILPGGLFICSGIARERRAKSLPRWKRRAMKIWRFSTTANGRPSPPNGRERLLHRGRPPFPGGRPPRGQGAAPAPRR